MATTRLSSRALAQLLGTWRGAGSAYAELADAVRVLCLDRRIAPGTALPAERDLAARLGVSRTTVAAAYRSLRESGHIHSLRGSGSVTRPIPSTPAASVATGGLLDLQQASPDAWEGLPALYAHAAEHAPAMTRSHGYDLIGAPGLRDAIATRYTSAGLETHADQILVTTGAQSAIALLAEVLTRRGDRVAIETPTYPHAAEAFRSADNHLVAVPVDPDSGWDVERAENVLRRAAPSIAYLMPDFQNPTGASMPAAQRIRILEAARDAGVIVIADETTADLEIDPGHAMPPFGTGADPTLLRQLVSIGSLGKTVWGGLRIGWIRADQELVARLVAARPRRDLGTPQFEQIVAELALARMPEILVSRSRTLALSRASLVEGLRARLPEWRVPTPHGGVALWVGLGAPLSSPLALAARERGVVLSSGPRFGADGGHERHIRIPFTAAPPVMEAAVEHLVGAWHDVLARGWRAADTLLAVI